MQNRAAARDDATDLATTASPSAAGTARHSLRNYALLLALIAVVCITAVSLLGGNLNKSYSKDASSVAATPG